MANIFYVPRFLSVGDPKLEETFTYLKNKYGKTARVLIAYEAETIDPGEKDLFDSGVNITDADASAMYTLGVGAKTSKGKPTDPNSL